MSERSILPANSAPGRSGVAPGHGGTPPGHGGIAPGLTGVPAGQVEAVTAIAPLLAIAALSGAGTVTTGGGGFATPAFVQGKRVAGGGAGGTTIALNSAVTVGNTILVITSLQGNTITGLSDTLGNVYTAIGAQQSGLFTTKNQFWWANVATAGTPTITVAQSGGALTSSNIAAVEVSGLDQTSPAVDVKYQTNNPGTTGTDNTTVGPVNVNTPAYVLAYLSDYSTDNFSAGSAFTQRLRSAQGSGANGFLVEERVLTSGATTTATFTLTTADQVDIGVATFKPRAL